MSIENEEISFSLPANKIILAFLQMKRAEQLKSIELGMKFLTYGNGQIQSWNNDEWNNKFEKERADYDIKINKYKELLSNQQDTIRSLKDNYAEQIRSVSNDIRTSTSLQYEETINKLRASLHEHQAQITSLNNNANEQYRQAYLDFENKLSNKEKIWEARLDKEKAEKNSLITRTQNSTIIGQDGESITLHELTRRFPKAEIEDTHKQKGRGDFIFKDKDFSMMVETKNYKNNVTKPEIDKFYRDIDTNHDIQCGILISLKSGICSRDDFHLEVREGKPILFLHNITKNFDNMGLAIKLFKLILKPDTIDLSCTETVEKIKNSVPIIKRNWNSMRQQIKKFEQDMSTCVAEQESLIFSFLKLLNISY